MLKTKFMQHKQAHLFTFIPTLTLNLDLNTLTVQMFVEML